MERGKHTKQNIDLLDFFTTHDLLPPLLSRRNKVENSWQPAFGRFWSIHDAFKQVGGSASIV